jgi:hypothetical protein
MPYPQCSKKLLVSLALTAESAIPRASTRPSRAPTQSVGLLLLVNVLLYERAELLIGEPLLRMNLISVLAGCFEELFVVVGIQVVTLRRTSAWGRGKPPPAQCQSTARMPPNHHAQCRTHVRQSIASKCAPRKNLLSWRPRSHAISSSMSWSRRSSRLWMSASLPFLRAHSR